MKRRLNNHGLFFGLKLVFCLIIASGMAQAEKKRALFELVSTESCPYCVTSTAFINEWKRPGAPAYIGHDMARNWIIIHFHEDDHISGLMKNENSQEDPVEYRFGTGDGYPYTDKLAWYPWLVLDGEYITLSTWDELVDKVAAVREEETPMGLSLEGTVFNEFDANVKLTITSDEDLSSKDLRLFVAATMDSVSHTNEYEYNQYMHNDLFLEWIGTTGADSDCGDACEDGQSISVGKDETLVKTYTWTLDEEPPTNPDPNVNPISWDKKNIKIVAFVQDFGTAEILQSAMIARTGGVHTGLDNETLLPESISLNQNYPNPFNPSTRINFELTQQMFVTLTVYDLLGNRVKTLVHQEQYSGIQTVSWDGTDELGKVVSAGVYLYQLQAGEFNRTRKMLLLK